MLNNAHLLQCRSQNLYKVVAQNTRVIYVVFYFRIFKIDNKDDIL